MLGGEHGRAVCGGRVQGPCTALLWGGGTWPGQAGRALLTEKGAGGGDGTLNAFTSPVSFSPCAPRSPSRTGGVDDLDL